MTDPYRTHLEKLEGQNVTIHRAGAPNVEGKVQEVTEDGCEIGVKAEGDNPEKIENVFVAYRDIRGVGKTDWDMDVIAH